DMVDRLVAPQRLVFAANLKEELQLFPGRDFRRAQQSRYGEGAAGIRPGCRRRMILALEPAAQEDRHEAVAGAQHIIDLDREALAYDAVLYPRRDGSRKDNAAHASAFPHDSGF